MILDPIPTEPLETKPMAQIYLRKKVKHDNKLYYV